MNRLTDAFFMTSCKAADAYYNAQWPLWKRLINRVAKLKRILLALGAKFN